MTNLNTQKIIPTNKINMQFAYQAIADDFFIYEITADNVKGENYKHVVTSIYTEIKPLSLIKIYNKPIFFVLCKVTLKQDKSDSQPSKHIAYQQYKAKLINKSSISEKLTDRQLGRLLVQAIPRLKKIRQSEQHDNLDLTNSNDIPASEGVGLYYFQKSEGIGDVKVIRAFQIGIEPFTTDDEISVISIKGKTFTPRNHHKNNKGEYSAKILRMPSFDLDSFFEFIEKSKNKQKGSKKQDFDDDYILKAHKSRYKRMKSEMVIVDPKKPDLFFSSKAGVLAQFDNDVKSILAKYLTIEWQPLPHTYRQYHTDSDINKHYVKIHQLLCKQNIYVCYFEDKCEHPANLLLTYLQEKGLNAEIRKNKLEEFDVNKGFENQVINFVVHHDKAYYIDNKINDPYLSIHQYYQDKNILKQSLTIENLFPKTDKLSIAMIDNSLTEVVIKMEVLLGKLTLDIPEHNWQCVQARYKENEQNKLELVGYDVLTYQACSKNIDYKYFDMCDEQAEDIEELLYELKNSDDNLRKDEHLIINLDNYDNPVAYLIRETNYLPLPKFIELNNIMTEIYQSRKMGFKVKWAKEYIDRIANGQVVLKSKIRQLKQNEKPEKSFVEKLEQIISDSTKDIIDIKEYDKFKIANQSKDGQEFYSWLYATHNSLLNTSLKSGDSGYLEAVKGFCYSEHQDVNCYFTGTATNIDTKTSNFNNIRRIYSNEDSQDILEPHRLFSLMDTYHIRHKQTTVLPFLFKHLREFVEINMS